MCLPNALTMSRWPPQEVCLAVQAGAAGLPLQQALQELPSGTSCTSCGRAVQVPLLLLRYCCSRCCVSHWQGRLSASRVSGCA